MKPARLVSLLAIALAGCGGGGGNGTAARSYAGTYKGYVMDNLGISGPVDLTIDSSGNISGNLVDAYATGAIDANGQATLYTASGTFSPPGTPIVYASLTNSEGTQTFYLALVADPKAATGGGDPFAGEYSGIASDNEVGHLQSAPVAFTVDSQGVIRGESLTEVNGAEEWGIMSGAVTSKGALQYSITINGTQVYRASGQVYNPSQVGGQNGMSGLLTINGADQGEFTVFTQS